MFHRASSWWRLVTVALVSLAALAMTPPASAAPGPQLLSQSPQVNLSAAGRAVVRVSVAHAAGPLRVALFPRITQRATINALVAGRAPTTVPLSTTSISQSPSCHPGPHTTFSLWVTSTTAGGRLPCSQGPALTTHCVRATCDGVYPLELTSGSTTWWSLLTITTGASGRRLNVILNETITPGALAHPVALGTLLLALSAQSAPLSLAISYDALAAVAEHPPLKAALSRALKNAEHQLISAPAPSIDYGGLLDNGFTNEVTSQLALTSSLAPQVTGRYLSGPLWLSGSPTAADLNALAGAGSSNLIVPETSLAYPPSATLAWGAPFHISGAEVVTAITSDQPLDTLINTSLNDARKLALTLGTINFLHFEKPFATAPRYLVVGAEAASTDAPFVTGLVASLRHDPVASLSPLAPAFNTQLIGTNGAPTIKTFVPTPSQPWSSQNVASLVHLIDTTTSYAGAITDKSVIGALVRHVGDAEINAPADQRQSAIDAAQANLTRQFSYFRVDASAVTLAGTGTSLPITIENKAHYTVTALVHLITDRLHFTHGDTFPVTLDAPTKSLRVAISKATGSSLILQVVVTTPDGQVTLARTALQVHVAGTSVVGYLLTGLSLLVLAVWWLRNARARRRR